MLSNAARCAMDLFTGDCQDRVGDPARLQFKHYSFLPSTGAIARSSLMRVTNMSGVSDCGPSERALAGS